MPCYDYEHLEPPCAQGSDFEHCHSIHDPALDACPACGGPVRRLLSPVMISVPRSDAQIRDVGFTKLVRRDDGVYENVTARGTESRYVHQGAIPLCFSPTAKEFTSRDPTTGSGLGSTWMPATRHRFQAT